jgi:hypothetical protein
MFSDFPTASIAVKSFKKASRKTQPLKITIKSSADKVKPQTLVNYDWAIVEHESLFDVTTGLGGSKKMTKAYFDAIREVLEARNDTYTVREILSDLKQVDGIGPVKFSLLYLVLTGEPIPLEELVAEASTTILFNQSNRDDSRDFDLRFIDCLKHLVKPSATYQKKEAVDKTIDYFMYLIPKKYKRVVTNPLRYTREYIFDLMKLKCLDDISEEKSLYTKENFHESECWFNNLLNDPESFSLIDGATKQYELIPYNEIKTNDGIVRVDLDNSQISAVENILKEKINLHLLDAPPGYGKSETIAKLYKHLTTMKYKVLVVAPTNKACVNLSKRMAMCNYEYLVKGIPKRLVRTFYYHSTLISNHNSPSPDVVIVDESSMLATNHLHLLRTMGASHIILIGDHQQLQPVEAGCPFLDAVHKSPHVHSLSIFHRSEALDIESYIRSIRETKNGCEWHTIKSENVSSIILSDDKLNKSISKKYESIIQNDGDILDEFAVIAPTNDACKNINTFCYNELCPPEEKISYKSGMPAPCCWVGAKVRCKVNDTTKGMINQLYYKVIGVKKDIFSPKNSKVMTINELGDKKSYELNEFNMYFTLAFASTVHSYQGSAADVVVFIADGIADAGFFNRNLIYTAVSRARKKIVVVSTGEKTHNIFDCNKRQTLIADLL